MSRKVWLLVALAAAAPAMALTDGWDIEDEAAVRQWRTASLNWAKAVHPEHPTVATIQAEVSAPPREMWCPTAGSWPVDCEAWDAHMDVWLHHYLEIPYGEALPSDLPAWPKECSSSCGTF